MQNPLDAVHEYYKAFSTLDLNAIVFHFCEPCMTVSSKGLVAVRSRAELADALRPLVEGLRAKGYGRSEFVEGVFTQLGETAALVRGTAVRYTAAGPEMERVPISYLMHRDDESWRIAVLIAEG